MMTDPEYCEIDVTARATLEKRTVVIGTGMHPCVETLILSRKIEGCTSLTFARVDLTRLHDSLAGWDETEFDVYQD